MYLMYFYYCANKVRLFVLITNSWTKRPYNLGSMNPAINSKDVLGVFSKLFFLLMDEFIIKTQVVIVGTCL